MRVPFDDAYKTKSIFDTPKLQLDKDEVARICCIEPESEVVMCHWLQIGEKSRDNGYHKCLGRYEVIFGDPSTGVVGQGHDSEQCEFCRAQVRLSQDANGVNIVVKRFGTNILKYLTMPNGEPRQPIMADCVVFVMGNDKYSRLTDLRKEYGDPKYGLCVRDLQVKCTVKQYQKFDINPLRECLWTSSGPQIQQQMLALWKQYRVPLENLDDLLANTVDHQTAQKLVAEATGVGSPAMSIPASVGVAPSASELQSLLDTSTPASTVAPGLKGNVQAPIEFIGQPKPLEPPTIAPVLVPSSQIPLSTVVIPKSAPTTPSIESFEDLLRIPNK